MNDEEVCPTLVPRVPSALVSAARVRVLVCALLLLAWSPAEPNRGSPSDAYDAMTELELDKAAAIIANLRSNSSLAAVLRARLLLYRGDCVAANTVLSAPHLRETPEAAGLRELAGTCAGATASAQVVEDLERGVWIRVQDQKDRVLVPLLAEVASRARDALMRDLGIELPRPLRIDLVRDQYSLAMVSGLPLEAAQTTGTVGVARWGRVIMLSPRATLSGFPWQDTLAHEMTHLAVTRASRDHAPLWLQEGIAKREETRWRTARPLDERTNHSAQARDALMTGKDVGVDRLGPSIAMLPTPETASIAYAEVASFVDFWVHENGLPGLMLLLLELKLKTGAEDTDRALRSVTGYPLEDWIARWKLHLGLAESPSAARSPSDAGAKSPDLVRAIRLGDLLVARGFFTEATVPLTRAVQGAPTLASVRARLAHALSEAGRGDEVGDALGRIEGLDGLHAGWLASRGQVLVSGGDRIGAARIFDVALGIQPLTPEAACGQRGVRTAHSPSTHSPRIEPDQTTGIVLGFLGADLCEQARAWRRH